MDRDIAAARNKARRAVRLAAMTTAELADFRRDAVVRARAWERLHPKPKKPRPIVTEAERAARADRAKARKKQYAAENADHVRAKKAEWERNNAERLREKYAARYAANREQHLAGSKIRHEANKVRDNTRKAAWYQRNRDSQVAKQRERNAADPHYQQRRRAEDVAFAIECRLRTRLQKALKAQGAVRAANTFALIGCTPEQFRHYVEALFLPGMTWENRSKWHLDHKLPCAHFDLTDPAQQVVCFHYTNIQPLWGADNLRKSAKVLPEYLKAA